MKTKIFKKHSLLLISILLLTLPLLCGCGKKFWEYDCVWVSDEPYVYIPSSTSQNATLILDGVTYDTNCAWENDGSGIDFYDPEIEHGINDKSIIWSVSCKIKEDKLYITVNTDNVSNYEGKTIILHQEPLE